jgi:hypothetical protein
MVQDNITIIVIVLGALLLVTIGFIVYLFMRTRRLELECELLLRGTEGTNFVEIVNDNIDQVHGLLGEVDALSERYAAVLRRIAGAVQHVGVVRFDAFRDLGGLLSFAVALLDDRGNGLCFSSIYGRSESRTYAKPIIERSSSYELSPEEREAIKLAMQSKDMGALPVEAKDRDHEERMANLRLFHDREYVQRQPEREARLEPEDRDRLERATVGERERPERKPPPRRPVDDNTPARVAREKDRDQKPPDEQQRKRRAGRVNHIRQVDRTADKPPDKAAERPPDRTTERPPERPASTPDRTEFVEPSPTGRSLEEEVQALLEPEEEMSARDAKVDSAPRSTGRAPRRPTEPRPRGLDTPVDRLRNREPD